MPDADEQGGRYRSHDYRGTWPRRADPVQKAWIRFNVPQCGYCQSGQIMQAAALLKTNSKPMRFWKYLQSYEWAGDAEIAGHLDPISTRINGACSPASNS